MRRSRANAPADEPLGGVLESDDCADDYPVTSPFLYLLLVQRTLLEGLEGRVSRKEEGEPPAEEGWSVRGVIGGPYSERESHARRRETRNMSMISDVFCVAPIRTSRVIGCSWVCAMCKVARCR
jgi:hypothetical protein